MSARHHDLVTDIDEIDYPESDGEPMAETGLHAQLMIDLRFALNRRFREDPQVYIGIDMLMYWVKGDKTKSKAPDVFVVMGVPKLPLRRTWKVWVEGKAPDVIFEVSSLKTWREDVFEKWRIYERIGVREYFIFDPEYTYAPESLVVWKLVDKQYIQQPVNNGVYYSDVLGLELVDTGETLRFRDPESGQFLPTDEEEIVARQKAEAERQKALTECQKAEVRAQEAEAEVERLRQELARLKK
ncbi:MAG TPA: Uma2 family endonuclease [Blastocatellia bacterium]|nr:Uma2 family endonuclease [Blastocatellia bacterium]